MIIMALDVATKTGWAVYDTDRPQSSILTGSFRCEGKSAFEKVCSLRQKLPAILRKHAPEFVAIEAPLDHVPRFKKKTNDLLGEGVQETTINAGTILQLSRLNGAVLGIVLGFNKPCCEVRAQTWQTVIPKAIKGKPKERAKAFCEMMSISGSNVDSRDAAVIAVWAAGHAQELKLMKRASEAA